jgi:Carboxypeptidase regulatory-like domain/TonB dependent receptor
MKLVLIHGRRNLRLAFSVLLLTIWAATAILAQSNTATISGIVTDASGAAVVGAKVDVKNVGTGITQSRISDSQGRYRVPELVIGDYEVQATQTGFQTVVHTGITVTVGGEAIIDFSLPVGQSQQTVTVEAQASQVDTSSSAVATLVEPTQMTDLPLNGRNFEQLLTLAPGVVTIPASGGGFYGRQDNYSIAGSRPLGQAFIIDNQNFLSFWGHATGSGATGASLGIEAIGEFQALTNTYSAQFGGSGGAVNAASKSGTNSFHGSAFEFLRNSALDSRSPFDVTVFPGNTTATVPAFRRNQYGGSLGGPIKKDKAFFFVNYEGLRALQGQSSVANNLPDANAHNGLLPCSLVNGTPYACTQPGQTLAPVAPSNPAAAAAVTQIMALFPVVPASPTGSGNATFVGNNISHEDYMLVRGDYNISSKDSVFVRYVRDYATFTTPLNGSPIPLFQEKDNTANNFATIEERHIFSPTLVNLARISFSRPTETAAQDSPQVQALVFVPGQPNGRVAVNGTTIGTSMQMPYYLIPNHFIESDDLILTHGGHSIRFGAALERILDNTSSPGQLGGQYTFPSLVSFLSGAPTAVAIPLQGQTDAVRDLRTWTFTPYVQDEWKVNRKLTLNLGVRYEWVSNPTERLNRLHNFTNITNGIVLDTNFVSVPNEFVSNITDRNFAPRLGFAYDPFSDHKTSIRGGFGIFYNLLTGKDVLPAYWLVTPFASANGTNPSFPNPYAGNGVAAPLPTEAQGIYYGAGRTPTTIQYNLNIQRELTQGMILTVGYTGSRGEHLLLTRDYNTPQLINGLWGFAANTANPLTGQVVAGPAGSTIPFAKYNQGLAGISLRNTVGNSNYNGLIVSLNRRFSQRWQSQISYTYSKALDNGSAGQGAEGGPTAPQNITNPYNAAIDYGRSTFDRTQALRISGVYELPGKGLLLGGWRMTGLISRATGAPLSLLVGFDRSGLGGGAGIRPNLAPGATGNPVLGGPLKYYDPNAFLLEAAGTAGNLGRTTLSGPGLVNADVAFLKNTPIRKISDVFNVQFRAELFDIANHPNWGQPVGNIFLSGVTPAGQPDGSGTRNPAAGRINNILGTTRQIQFGIRIGF